ncbi:DsbA family protein [Anaerobiospirillum thomasii]|uniref:DsbA family protein n=1 Tax=Anaerobiospirillum thomasii TaxID=179995 RepID=UPI000DE58458|nr:DsbA family protein [Anaerobiospirillum thomasii]
MKKIISALSIVACMSTAMAADNFTVDEKAQIEQIVHNYIVSHPEVLIEAQEKLEAQYSQMMAQAIPKAAEAFINDPDTPKFGNKDSKHYVIEFFDYNCGYCKTVRPHIAKYVKEKDALLVLIEYPILSQISVKASAIGLALHSVDKDKYYKYQEYLMSSKEKITSEAQLKEAVAKAGGNFGELIEIVKDPKIQNMLKKNMIQGQSIGVMGTPFFIIDGKAIRGAIRSYEDLLQRLE